MAHTERAGPGQASFGYAYPGQAASNVRDSAGNMAGYWSYVDLDGNLVRAAYTADKRGFLVSSTNEGPAKVSTAYRSNDCRLQCHKSFQPPPKSRLEIQNGSKWRNVSESIPVQR